MCKGAESKFFNGHTNIVDDQFITFGVKGLMDTNKRLKDVMLFNILSFMNHKLLTDGNTVAAIDELYLFLTNLTSIEYIRNASKRVRKKDSNIVLASQNIEDFMLHGIREYTKPLFSIPTHQFLFNAGNIDLYQYPIKKFIKNQVKILIYDFYADFLSTLLLDIGITYLHGRFTNRTKRVRSHKIPRPRSLPLQMRK